MIPEEAPAPTAAEREASAKGTLGYSAWDLLPLSYPGLQTQLEFEPIEFAAVRYERRTRGYAAAKEMGREAGPEVLVRLAAEHEANVDAWAGKLRRAGGGPIRWYEHPIARVPMVMMVVSVMLGARDLYQGQPPVLTLIMIALAAAFWIGMSWWIRRGPRRSGGPGEPVNVHDLSSALARRMCPDCGYGLTGVVPAIDGELVNGIDVGPEICPECTSRWPLVPPAGGLAPRSSRQARSAGK